MLVPKAHILYGSETTGIQQSLREKRSDLGTLAVSFHVDFTVHDVAALSSDRGSA